MIRALRSASFLPLLLIACKKGDKVPAYVHVPGVQLTATSEQGGSTSNITDAWVYANDELLGCWELPAEIPVLAEGPVTIRVAPGVKRNGMYDDRLIYPFYTAWTGTAELVPTGSTGVSPVVQYGANAASFWVDSFGDAGSDLLVAESSDTTLDRFTDASIILPGSGQCGGFVLTPGHEDMYIYTDKDFTPTGGPTFLELDYRCNVQFTVGVLYALNGVAHADDFVYVAPTTQPGGTTIWKKMYIDLSPPFNSGISQRDIFISASLPAGQGSAHVYLDNIKVVK